MIEELRLALLDFKWSSNQDRLLTRHGYQALSRARPEKPSVLSISQGSKIFIFVSSRPGALYLYVSTWVFLIV